MREVIRSKADCLLQQVLVHEPEESTGRSTCKEFLVVIRAGLSVSTFDLFCVFTHVASIYANLLEQKEAFT